jgi:hypothetical protein
MTTERALNLDEIRQRLDAITPPPWILMPELCGPEGQAVYELDSMGPICEVGDPYPRSSNRPQANMTFIAHAPDDMRALIAENEALRTALRDLYHPIENGTAAGASWRIRVETARVLLGAQDRDQPSKPDPRGWEREAHQ